MDLPFSETVLIVGAVGFAAAWVVNTLIRVRHGYPLESSWGKPMLPKGDPQSVERVKLLTQENAQLRAEVGSMKDRLANVERIVTDSGYGLGHEIEKLRDARDVARNNEHGSGVPFETRETEGHA